MLQIPNLLSYSNNLTMFCIASCMSWNASFPTELPRASACSIDWRLLEITEPIRKTVQVFEDVAYADTILALG